MAKLFERVIKKKLEVHLEQTRGISKHQFGFRRCHSTINAINSAMEVVNKVGSGPLRRTELCAMVFLDMKNTFTLPRGSESKSRWSQKRYRRTQYKY